MVPFACVCDVNVCKARSREYSLWPTCRVCHADVCDDEKHRRPGTFRDDDGKQTVICVNCSPADDPTGLLATLES
jgi:hypothetical protein